ncbi:1428_t:CDS:2 [Entrophospora sp. SA101]|nr:1428_t:CDS:2 [Entrophospora sp. SA101]
MTCLKQLNFTIWKSLLEIDIDGSNRKVVTTDRYDESTVIIDKENSEEYDHRKDIEKIHGWVGSGQDVGERVLTQFLVFIG